MVIPHNWLPHTFLSFIFSRRWHLNLNSKPWRGIHSSWVPHVYMNYACQQSSVCLSLVNLSFIPGVSAKNLEGLREILFLP